MISTIIILAILFIKLGLALAWHGETKEVTYNFYLYLLSTLLCLWLFYNAGLFDKFLN